MTRVHNCVAGAVISLRKLPTKLNPIIRPIMDSIKLELDPTLQVQHISSVFLFQIFIFFETHVFSVATSRGVALCDVAVVQGTNTLP